MSQPIKILSASCLALALIFGAEKEALAVKIDDTLSIEAGLARCTENTKLAQLTIDGCYKGLQLVSSNFPFRNKQFKDLTTCLDTMKSLDLHSLLEKEFKRCDKEWTHIYFRRGCKDAAIAYYSNLDPVTFCTRGGVGTVPIMPLNPDPANRDSELQLVLSQPLLPPMTPIYQKAPAKRPAPVASASKAANKKDSTQAAPALSEEKAKAPAKTTAKPVEKAVKPVAETAKAAGKPTPPEQVVITIVTDGKPANSNPKSQLSVDVAPGEISVSETLPNTAPATPVDNASFVSATNVTGNLIQQQTDSIAVPFKPAAPDSNSQQTVAVPAPPAIPLIPSGQAAQPHQQEAHVDLPRPNQFVYQNQSAQDPTSLRDIPLGVPNQPVEGLASVPSTGSLSSPALPPMSPAIPEPSVASPALPATSNAVPTSALPAPVISEPTTMPVAPQTPVTAPNGAQQPTGMPGAESPAPMASMPGFATPGMAPQSPVAAPALPGFFSNPDQTQTHSNFIGNKEPSPSSPEAASEEQTVSGARPGAPTPPPSLSEPFALDPR